MPALADLLPPEPTSDPDVLLNRFLAWVPSTGLTLYPAQEEALLELMAGKHVMLATPTGSGKSLVARRAPLQGAGRGEALLLHVPDQGAGEREVLRALRALRRRARRHADRRRHASTATRRSSAAPPRSSPTWRCARPSRRVDYVVMDEFHYYADRERGVAWQMPLLTLPHATFLLMSATLGDTTAIEKSLHELTGREVAVVRTRAPRAARLRVPRDAAARDHRGPGQGRTGPDLPGQLHPARRRRAGAEPDEPTSPPRRRRRRSAPTLDGARFDTPVRQGAAAFLSHGIGLHHAGLLPKYRLLVEKLAQSGPAQGRQRHRHAGRGREHPHPHRALHPALQVRRREDGHPLRARLPADRRTRRRKGFDDRGRVVAQAPEHVIENLKLGQKAAAGKKVVRKPPRRATCTGTGRPSSGSWRSSPSRSSRASTSPTACCSTLLQARRTGAGRRLRPARRIIGRSHDTETRKKQLLAKQRGQFRTLRDAGLVAIFKHPHARSAGWRSRRSCRRLLAAPHALALPARHPAPARPRGADYALDVLTLVESILENPELVLLKQLDALKSEAARRAEGARGRVRRADGGARQARVPQAAPRLHLRHLQRVRRRSTRGWGTRTSGPSRSRARCSSASRPSTTTCGSTGCSAARACCCATCPTSTRRWSRRCPRATATRRSTRRQSLRRDGARRRLEPPRRVGAAAASRRCASPADGHRRPGRSLLAGDLRPRSRRAPPPPQGHRR